MRRCDWENFINRFSNDGPIYAIEALVTGDQLGKEMIEEAQRRKDSGYFQAADYEAQSRVTRLHTNTVWVQRVRIQSPRLLEVLRQVTGYAWATNSYTFLHPFQYLIQHHEALKQELDRLASLEATADVSQYSSEQRSSAVHHLRCYIDFVETDILPRYQLLRGGVQHGSLRVRFHELWYLFKSSDLIYMPEKTIKRYTIAHVDKDVLWSFNTSDESTMRQRVWRLWNLDISPTDPASPVNPHADNGSFFAFGYYLDFDGSSYSPVAWNFSIPYFEGEKGVRDLEFYPLQYARGASELLKEQIKIGELFTRCRQEWHMMYSGWTFTTHPVGSPIIDVRFDVKRQILPEYVEGEVIVDFFEAYNAEPLFKETFADQESWTYSVTPSRAVPGLDLLVVWSDSSRSSIVSGLHEIIITQDIEHIEYEDCIKKDKYMRPDRDLNIVPEGDDLALLPRRVYVYSLRDSKFVAVDVQHLKSLHWRDDGFSQLQLQEDHKLVIQSSVRSYLKRRPVERRIEKAKSGMLYTQDFIRGKGRGLLIMLHGEPGTGKTATAEAVAQTYRRPLLSISCGCWDHPRMLEQGLEEVFRLANLWDCILLLDEADVFLTARASTDNVSRNSLVSSKYHTYPETSSMQSHADPVLESS